MIAYFGSLVIFSGFGIVTNNNSNCAEMLDHCILINCYVNNYYHNHVIHIFIFIREGIGMQRIWWNYLLSYILVVESADFILLGGGGVLSHSGQGIPISDQCTHSLPNDNSSCFINHAVHFLACSEQLQQ